MLGRESIFVRSMAPNLSCCELFDERYFASSNDLQYLGREEAIVIELPRIGPLNTIPFLRGRLDKAQLAEVCQDEAICHGWIRRTRQLDMEDKSYGVSFLFHVNLSRQGWKFVSWEVIGDPGPTNCC